MQEDARRMAPSVLTRVKLTPPSRLTSTSVADDAETLERTMTTVSVLGSYSQLSTVLRDVSPLVLPSAVQVAPLSSLYQLSTTALPPAGWACWMKATSRPDGSTMKSGW